ncbi:hypothetical protein H0H92_016113 [Tricholoma furcatifolium]|nr:hypothetical protein H0H92_016113 [Tricholoma furcatifolium]
MAQACSKAGTILVPLNVLDRTWLDQSSITLGYVLSTVDIPKIEAAAKRLVDKWRLLAGHLEWSKEHSIWCIRVPLEGDVLHRLTFTTSKLDTPLDSGAFPSLDPTLAEIIVRPSLQYFRHSSVPNSVEAFASSKAPFLSIHVSELTSCACLGISVPHSIFDAFGLGQIIRGLDAELKGTRWEVPQSFEINIVQKALDELAATHPHSTQAPQANAMIAVQRDVVPSSIKNAISCRIAVAYEYFWKKTETKAVYMADAVVNELVEKVKNEVKGSGNEWVSTGDILVAWFLKEEIASKSLAELALNYRRAINVTRNVSFINAYYQWLFEIKRKPTLGPKLGVITYKVTNQVIGHFDDINFGHDMLALWHWNLPFTDRLIVLNKFKGGYIIQGTMRSMWWDAVAEVVRKQVIHLA